jgi:hypothetical protein
MTSHRLPALGLALTVLWLAGPVRAQQDRALPEPRLNSVLPMGAKAGTTVEVTVTGTDIEDPEALLFSHPGIKATPIAVPEPPEPDPKKPAPKKGPKPSVTRFTVTIPPDCPLGIHDVRLANSWGVSNARAFVVGDLAEVLEKEPNNDVPEAQRVELNSTINGVLSSPTDVDYYLFTGKKGQRVLFSCLASSIDSRAHPALEVYDVRGRLLTSNRNYFENDALADVTLPEDGDYLVRLFEFTYTQGSADHFYRLSLSTTPWIDAIHPCVVEAGKPATITIHGRNLPGGIPDPTAFSDGRPLEKITITITPPAPVGNRLAYSGYLRPGTAALDGGFEYRTRNAAGSSNPFLLTYAHAPVVLDNEKVRTAESAQEVPIPCEIAGRVEKKRDRDWYVFTAKKGDVINIEVLSERLGAPTSMYIVLRKADSKDLLFESPDNAEIVSPKFYARTDDPAPYRFQVPADGRYALLVASRLADTLYGPRHFYRVRLTPDLPDFQVAVLPPAFHRPDGVTVPKAGHTNLEVFAWRRDGFVGDITLTVEGLPAGVTAVPQTLGGPLRHSFLVISAADNAAPWTGPITVKATATIKGQVQVREARIGAVVWPVPPQQGIPNLGRLDRSLALAVRDKAPMTLTATPDKITTAQGTNVNVALKLTRHRDDLKAPITIAALLPNQQQPPLTFLPPSLTINNGQPLNLAPDKNDGSVTVAVNATTPPGTYTLVLFAQTTIPYNKDPKNPQKQPAILLEPSSAITLTVLPKAIANVSLANATVAVKAGTTGEVVVKVQRMHNFAGELKVQVVLPPNTADVQIPEAVIPAGQDEVKLQVTVPAAANPGNRPNLIVRTTGMYNGTVSISQDAPPLTINVTK